MAESIGASPPHSSGRQFGALFYCIGFISFQLVVFVGVLLLTPTWWFLTHDNYPGVVQAGYGSRLTHADCEIVLYGDSSALTALDPAVIQDTFLAGQHLASFHKNCTRS